MKKRNTTVPIFVLSLVLCACASNSEGTIEEYEWETVEHTEVNEMSADADILQEEDYIKSISGSWKLDGAKTNQELANNNISLQELFGTGLQLGAGVEIGEEGSFRYYIGIGIGGEGSCSYENGMVTAVITPFENHAQEATETRQLYLSTDDEKEYLVMKYDDYELYWTREEN